MTSLKRKDAKGKSKLITQIAYAKKIGVTRQAISQQVADRVISLTDGLIDPDLADKQRVEKLDPVNSFRHAANRQGGTDVDGLALKTYNSARAREKYFNAKTAELRYEIESGNLLRREEVAHAQETSARKIRDRLLVIPDRLAPQLAAEKNEGKIHMKIIKEIKAAIKGAV